MKTETVKKHMKRGEWKKALRLAASFGRLKEHKDAIQKAHSALLNADFYKSMGYNVDELFQNGIKALKALYPDYESELTLEDPNELICNLDNNWFVCRVCGRSAHRAKSIKHTKFCPANEN